MDILNNLIYIYNLLPVYIDPIVLFSSLIIILTPIVLFTSLIKILTPIVLFSSKKVIIDTAGRIITAAGNLAVIGTAVNTGFGSKLINKDDKNNNNGSDSNNNSNNSKDDKNNNNDKNENATHHLHPKVKNKLKFNNKIHYSFFISICIRLFWFIYT
jgi:hypothetical protein